jgi:hypothetical protein
MFFIQPLVQAGNARYPRLSLRGNVEDMQLIQFDFLSLIVLIYCNSILVCVASLYKRA